MEYFYLLLVAIVLYYSLSKLAYEEEMKPIEYNCIDDEEYVAYSEGWHENVSDIDILNVKSTIVNMRVTAYAPYDNRSGICAENSLNPRTSTGLRPKHAYIAADPEKLPYGTKLIIPGYGLVEVQDTGYALREYEGYAIDVYFDTYEEAIMWGKKYIDVEILE